MSNVVYALSRFGSLNAVAVGQTPRNFVPS